jgi:DNA (cytosine-5)-methyltransferase 1
MSKQSKFRFIDLFAGVGGIRIPFDELGGTCTFTSEIDEKAALTYELNFHEKPSGDIREFDAQDIPEHDLLLAGFPCQPFSLAGLKKGFDDAARGTLFFDIARIAQHHKPTALLLENVKGLVNHDKGNTMRVIERRLDELGYWVHAKILNARDFGLPQNRERIYIVALRKDLVGSWEFNFPDAPRTKTRVGSILESPSRVGDDFTISDRLWEGHQRRKREHELRGNGFGYSLFTKDSPYTSTISARYYKDGSEILIDQGVDALGRKLNPRKLTPREAARLQGFPESFILNPSASQAYKQFGNAVAVPVVRAIAEELVPLIKKGKVRAASGLVS